MKLQSKWTFILKHFKAVINSRAPKLLFQQ